MTIGIPQALPYFHYGVLWETFFDALNVPYARSGPTSEKTITAGVKYAVDETCLPYKLYMGHVASLIGKTDKILVPYLRRTGRQDEFCVRFWGLYDAVASTFPELDLISYPLASGRKNAEMLSFLALGKTLGKSRAATIHAYRLAKDAQEKKIQTKFSEMRAKLQQNNLNILLAGQAYLLDDPFIGGIITKEIEQLDAAAITVDAWEARKRNLQAEKIAPELYLHKNREIVGAVEQGRYQVDAVILLTAFPCGTDCLTNALIRGHVKNLPIMELLIDEHQGREGLITRLESFIDLVETRKKYNLSEAI